MYKLKQILKHDKFLIFCGTEDECYQKLQKLQPFSAEYAIKNGGWEVEKIKHKTTEEHYKKYKEICDERMIAYSYLDNFMGYTAQELLHHYLRDENLNTIPLEKWDHMIQTRNTHPNKTVRKITIAENVCLNKHIVKYHILGIEPEFINEN